MIDRTAWDASCDAFAPSLKTRGLEPLGDEAVPGLGDAIFAALGFANDAWPVWVVPEPHGAGWEVCREMEGGCWPLTVIALVIGLSGERERFSSLGGRVFLSPEAFQALQEERDK